MIKDAYGYIINDVQNYTEIAQLLKTNQSVIFPWTDQKMAGYDILLNVRPYKMCELGLQSGLQTNYLFVTVMRCGAFAFEKPTVSTDLVSKKLNIGYKETAHRFAQLINGILEKLK